MAEFFPIPKGVSYSWGRTDEGVDIEFPAGSVGKPLLAMANGTISRIFNSGPGAFGPSLLTLHTDDGRYIYYGHSKALVRQGQRVKAGQAVALITRQSAAYGSAGASSDPSWGHLEIGYGTAAGTSAAAFPHYSEGQATAEGKSFRGLLDKLTGKQTAATGGGGGGFNPIPDVIPSTGDIANDVVKALFGPVVNQGRYAAVAVLLVLGGVALFATGTRTAAGTAKGATA